MSALRLPRAIAAVTVAGVSFLTVFWLMVLPLLREVGQEQAKLEAVSRSALSLPAEKKGVSASRAKLDAQAETALALLPTDDRQYDLTVEIEALAHTIGVSLTALGVTTAQPAGQKTASAASTPADLEKVTVSVGVGGSYDRVQQFAEGLHGLSRFLQIDQLTVTGGSTAQGPTDQVSAQITAYAYYLPSVK